MVEMSWAGTAPASIDRVWSILSNTDAFNRRAGLGFRFKAERGVVRGQSTLAGVTTTWTEKPFRWVAPQWFESTRVYDGGPVSEAYTRCELKEGPEGTKWSYRVELTPRNSLFAPVVSGLSKLVLRPMLDRALKAVEGVLVGNDQDWDPPPELDRDTHLRLENRLRWVPEAVADGLRRRVLNSPLATTACLRPLEFAEQEGLSEDDAIEGFMLAVKGKALRLSWRVICPECRTTSIEVAPLSAGAQPSHCETCGITIDGSVAENIEAIFSVDSSIRPGPAPMDCILSPRWTPHVLAQLSLKPRGEVELPVMLEAGCYRVEVKGIGAVWVEVTESADSNEAVIVIGRVTSPRLLQLRPGASRLRVSSQLPTAVDVSVVRRWRPPFVLSAARLLGTPTARVLIPEVMLAPGFRVRASSGWVVVAHGAATALDVLAKDLGDAEVFRCRPQLLVAVVSTSAEAVTAAESLVRGGGPVGVGLAHGVVVHLGSGDDRSLGGPAVDAAIRLLERVGRPRVAVAQADLKALQSGLKPMGGRVVVAQRDGRGLLAFGSMLEAGPPRASHPEGRSFEEEAPEAPIPERVGPYRVLREIDRGGMGQVLEAMDRDGKRIALKIILPGFMGSDALLQRFFNESWYASKVHHENVVEVLEFGLHGERPWLAMEFLSGSTLGKELGRVRRLAPSIAAGLLDGVLGGLSALHSVGLVHRDLKPGNVMVLTDQSKAPGGVKLMDFGLVRRAGRHPDEGLMGTPDYMAPEQLVGDDIGPPADVYAAGLLAYRMVVGRLPFRGEKKERVMERVSQEVDDLPDLHLLGELEPVVRAALAPVEDRPKDAAELRALLTAERTLS